MSATNTSDNEKRAKVKRIFRRSLRVLAGMFGLFFVLVTVLVIMAFNDLPPMGALENPQMDLSTQIFTADGELLGSFHSKENRVYVKRDEISDWVPKALIATEDERFYDHCGIDPKVVFTIPKDIVFYQRIRGGSSITQQLARNLYEEVGTSRSAMRKIKEAIVAIVLESRFTKEEILVAYLNTAPFYGNTYGVEMGARALFSKSAKDLELHEAALMIGMLRNPTYYSPTRNADRAKGVRNTVLGQMVRNGVITEAQADSTKELPLGLNTRGVNSTTSLAPYFKDHVRKFLKEWAGKYNKAIDLYSDGLKVYTTIDSRMQKYAEQAVSEHLSQLQVTFDKELKRTGEPWKKDKSILESAMKRTDRYKYAVAAGKSKKKIRDEFNKKVKMTIWTHQGYEEVEMSPRDSVIHYLKMLESGFMAMDPRTGEIRAWVGGINYRYFKYDHVFQGKRQVGSTFKPFVYTAGMDGGRHTPCDPVLDMKVSITLPDGKVWRPRNSGGKEDGLITYYEGLAQSKNQVTAALMKEVGPQVVCRYAAQMGIKTQLDCVPSLCLGTTDLSLYEMLGAYSVFANKGIYTEPIYVTRIEDKNGNILASFQPETHEAISEETAFMMVNMMMGVVDHLKGTARRLRTKYKFTNQIAGKTGTTQNNSDGWFIGVTPNLVGGAWVGCADRQVRFRRTLYGQGANMALPIWAIFMKLVYADSKIGLKAENFERPEDFNIPLVCKPLKGKDSTDYNPNQLPQFGDEM